MNEGIIILVFVAVIAVVYFGCALYRHGTCDMGKCFTLLVVAVGFITGIIIFLHAYHFLKAKVSSYEDAVWSAIAGMVLCLSSTLQIVTMFRELFAKKVDPIKTQD